MVMRPDGGAPVRSAAKPKTTSSKSTKSPGSLFTNPTRLISNMKSAAVRAAAKNPVAVASAAGRATARAAAPRSSGGGGRSYGGGSYGGGGISAPSYGGGGVSTLSTGVVAEPAPQPPKPSLEDWRAKDATFNAANQTIDTDLKSLLRQLADENAKYNQDWNLGLRNLGWDASANNGAGGWNPEDLLGAYGASRNNLFNDFSGRGMLDSSFFTQAQGDLDRNFERQRNDMVTDRDRVMGEYSAAQARAKQDAQNARQQALADAAARYAAMFGV